ncbi:MAG: GspH/FimT family pseudopilin [Proteobacteria bacterium]|nr:GspH/FimT family pseudopilin [Pseudomonadota bacterium]
MVNGQKIMNVEKLQHRRAGFTLVELMIVVAIMGILAGIAFSLMRNWLPNMRLRGAARDVYSVMQRAKAEAIERGVNVAIAYNTVANTYTMFVDVNSNRLQDAGEISLLSSGPMPDGVAFDNRPAPPLPATEVKGADGIVDGVSFAGNAVAFTPRGLPVGTGTVALLATTGRQRTVTVSIAGRVRMQ